MLWIANLLREKYLPIESLYSDRRRTCPRSEYRFAMLLPGSSMSAENDLFEAIV